MTTPAPNVARVIPTPLLTFVPLSSTALDSVLLDVRIARTDKSIGTILWAPEYRQYVWAPAPGRYTRSVLQAVSRKLHSLMAAWRRAHPDPRRGREGLSHAERDELAGKTRRRRERLQRSKDRWFDIHPPPKPAD